MKNKIIIYLVVVATVLASIVLAAFEYYKINSQPLYVARIPIRDKTDLPQGRVGRPDAKRLLSINDCNTDSLDKTANAYICDKIQLEYSSNLKIKKFPERIKFLTPDEFKILNNSAYTDQPLGFDVMLYDPGESSLYDWAEKTLNSDVAHIEHKLLDNGRNAYLATEPGVGEGSYAYYFEINNFVVSLSTYSEANLTNPSFLEILESIKEKCTPRIGYDYELRSRNPDYHTAEYFNQELIMKDQSNCTETILVKDIDLAVPALSPKGQVFMKFSFPKDSVNLYFLQALDGTDAPPAALYSFNLNSKRFFKMKISTYFGYHGTRVLSPEGNKIATIDRTDSDPNTNRLVLLDLAADKANTVLELKGDETLGQGKGDCFHAVNARFKWIDNKTLEYGVYDRSQEVDSNRSCLKPTYKLIELRSVTVN